MRAICKRRGCISRGEPGALPAPLFIAGDFNEHHADAFPQGDQRPTGLPWAELCHSAWWLAQAFGRMTDSELVSALSQGDLLELCDEE